MHRPDCEINFLAAIAYGQASKLEWELQEFAEDFIILLLKSKRAEYRVPLLSEYIDIDLKNFNFLQWWMKVYKNAAFPCVKLLKKIACFFIFS